ncbi:MAG: UpxY family transcription antiterminator [Prolixibacteraceae bacterium]|jgi:transcription antitermination factor NusG|nr:UpxY family transcription antiterminator [Prolixibacteraceae bacterium]
MENNKKQWFAVYTKSRAEKKVQLELEFQGIENFLPIHKKLRQWSDRKKWVEAPLISGYIFVYIEAIEYDRVLRTNGVVSYVRFEGKAAIIPENQINNLKRLLQQSELAIKVSTKNFTKGDEIEVLGGPLMGLQGTLILVKGKKKVAIQLKQLNIAFTVELALTDIRKL